MISVNQIVKPCIAVLVLVCACVEYGVSDEDEQAQELLVVEERFVQAAAPSVDLLWVVDNTASMAREQASLAGAFESFVAALDDEEVAYQLGVVTTDVSDDQAGVLQGIPWIVTPDHEDPVGAFSQAVQVGTDGAAPESGFGAAWLALTEPNLSGSNRGFRRDDALLHVVVVSDNDDGSEDVLGDEPGSAFLEFLDEEADRSGQDPIFSAVAGDVPNGCLGMAGRALPANAYHEVASATGGVFASICSGDMEPILQGIGTASLVYADTFPLQAVPYLDTIHVWVSEERQLEGWSWQDSPSAIVFDAPPAPDASIRVRYTVDEEQG